MFLIIYNLLWHAVIWPFFPQVVVCSLLSWLCFYLLVRRTALFLDLQLVSAPQELVSTFSSELLSTFSSELVSTASAELLSTLSSELMFTGSSMRAPVMLSRGGKLKQHRLAISTD